MYSLHIVSGEYSGLASSARAHPPVSPGTQSITESIVRPPHPPILFGPFEEPRTETVVLSVDSDHVEPLSHMTLAIICS
jgi:hypothetical protein